MATSPQICAKSNGVVMPDGCDECFVSCDTFDEFQTAVETALAEKQDKLTAGDNITIDDNNVISSHITKEEILEVLGYEEITATKIDEDGKLVTLYMLGRSTVEQMYPPTLYGVSNTVLDVDSEFDAMDGVFATDFRGDVIDVTVEGSVDTSVPGRYVLTYTATDAYGNTSTKERIVTVRSNAAYHDYIYDGDIEEASGTFATNQIALAVGDTIRYDSDYLGRGDYVIDDVDNISFVTAKNNTEINITVTDGFSEFIEVTVPQDLDDVEYIHLAVWKVDTGDEPPVTQYKNNISLQTVGDGFETIGEFAAINITDGDSTIASLDGGSFEIDGDTARYEWYTETQITVETDKQYNMVVNSLTIDGNELTFNATSTDVAEDSIVFATGATVFSSITASFATSPESE